VLKELEPREINKVLSANHSIWSPGLDRTRYRHYQWWQLNHSWGRRNLRYFGFFEGSSQVLASCKRYKLRFQSRGKVFSIAGIGAVFVDESKRGQSYGQKMLGEMADLCRQEDYDGILLNSDIDPAYYEKLGYHLFEADTFAVDLSPAWLNRSIRQLDSLSDISLDENFVVRDLAHADIAEMIRHHKRWLASVPYGMLRSEEYWHYKLGRERYLREHSSLNWPNLSIITDNYGQFTGGYALVEQSGSYMRVLEVVAPERIFNSLWSQILRLAQRRKITRLRGWRKIAPPLTGLKISSRDWSFPMICPLKQELADTFRSWIEILPTCMLELDHF